VSLKWLNNDAVHRSGTVVLLRLETTAGFFVMDAILAHTTRYCPLRPTMPPESATQPPPLSQASLAPWTIADGPGFIQNSQSATQNWVLGSSSSLLGMMVGAGYPAQSQSTYGGPPYGQGGHLQVPGTQYSQFQSLITKTFIYHFNSLNSNPIYLHKSPQICFEIGPEPIHL
jgi:hypothetical protein